MKQIPGETEQKEKNIMNAVEALDELQRKARHDDKLREQFIKTRDAEDPLGGFCSVCRETGYELYPMDIVQAGDVIGYIGRTGYSTEENVNNIDEYHLHFGLQLIFDESQREGDNEIWINCYELVRFLYQHQSEVQRNDETKEWTRLYQMKDPAIE